ncbi:MAG: YgiQ family radical SAM protein [Spirochaetae bacterium HGW-Spirochaetae-4]|nr:MAG: YgiQ family radical SAM protein [Spirochaetae bacterium HGW-Spirochaetae-4]
MNRNRPFLPLDRSDMERRGWDAVDVVFISGDAYVDHPSFGAALLGRLMEFHGYRVGIVAQPRWDRTDDFLQFGKPRLCCMVSSGNIDSMVSHYTANNRVRNDDPYSPGGKGGKRPDRAVITYSGRARQAFGKETPIIIGGLEASLRRLAHYDFWSDRIRRSVLLDAKADLLVYGMGELQTLEILKRLSAGEPVQTLVDIPGTAANIPSKSFDQHKEGRPGYAFVQLPSYEQVSEREKVSNTPSSESLHAYATSFQQQLLHENPFDKTVLIQESADRTIVVNPPMRPLTQAELDQVQELPYQRTWHPSYDSDGGIPALAEVQFSLTSNRGCFGSCSFCAITSHQGRIITNRSIASLERETEEITALPNFKGYIHDVGGPTANFQGIACKRQQTHGPCQNKLCLYPDPCNNLIDSHPAYLQRLEAIEAVPSVKKVFIRSGIRYDYLMATGTPESRKKFLDRLASNHTSGQLRVAPEHMDPAALDAMGKPKVEWYEQFVDDFMEASRHAGKEQYCIPYFIAAHPGTTLEGAVALAEYLHKTHFIPEQVQEFYPTPGTVATCMYFTGLDPRPGRNFASIHVPKGRERHMQRALLHYHKPEHRTLVLEALQLTGRSDLISVLLGAHRRSLPQNPKRGTARP